MLSHAKLEEANHAWSVKNMPRKLLSVLLVLAAVPPLFGQTHDCGGPPEDIQSYTLMKSYWKHYLCSSNKVGVDGKIAIDDVPLGVTYSDDERTCTEDEKQDMDATAKIEKYLATNETLRFAECGYRACQLKANGAKPKEMSGYYTICGVSANAQSSLKIVDPIVVVSVTKDQLGRTIHAEIPVHGSADARLPYTFVSDAGSTLTAVSATGSIPRGVGYSIGVTIRTPTILKRGDAKYLPYRLLGADKQPMLAGYVLVTRKTDPKSHCSEWKADACIKCEFPIGWEHEAFTHSDAYACGEMKEGDEVEATFDGTPVVYQGLAKDAWIQVRVNLNPEPDSQTKGCSGQGNYVKANSLNPNGDVCEPCTSGCRAGPPDNVWQHFTARLYDIVPNTRSENLLVILSHCQTTSKPQALCGVQPGAKFTIKDISPFATNAQN